MTSALRKALLVTTFGLCGLVSAPIGLSVIANGPAHPFSAAALADDDDGDDHGGGDRDGRGHDGRDDRDNDDRGGRDNDDRDDNDQGGHHGDRHRDDDDDDRDDDDFRDARARPEIELRVSEESLRGLRDGSLIAVDDLGRVLEVEVEFEHGVRVVKVEPHRGDFRRNPGPITTVSIRPAP
ncbi:hypothetical protein AB4Z34_21100 [Ensifer sp. 2YAB10]|uniref:hypothetical protein n=1 Tax=unclassified Ensifer TaxID=2633371 RepID=UPI003F8DFA85